MQRVSTFECEDCRTLTTRRLRADRPRVCFKCGVARSVDYQQKLYQVLVDRWGEELAAELMECRYLTSDLEE